MHFERQENYMMRRKKVILFLVEGFSDKSALEHIMNVLVEEKKVLFAVVNGDITSNEMTKVDNVVKKVGEQVKFCMNKYKIQKSDVIQVIHLVDADGVFIPDSHICKGNENGFFYTDEEIKAKHIEAVSARNERKSKMLEKLIGTGKICAIPYRVYFMSCNLDHVLYNVQNLSDDEKVEYADLFYEKYLGKEGEFLNLIEDKTIATEGSYKETWKYIEKDLNSLHRHSNLHLFFDNSI